MLQREGKLDAATATKIFLEMLQGLMYLHNKGPAILHNDINPTNVMLSSKTGGVAELIDMGHISHGFMGKVPFDTYDLDPRYASGQSFLGKYDERNDIFAATGVFYTMLTGRAPWDVEFTPEMTRKEKVQLVKKARNDQGEINVDDIEDEKLRAVISHGLALAYNERYECVEKIISDLIEGDDSEMAQEIRSKIDLSTDSDDDDAHDGINPFERQDDSESRGPRSQAASETSADVEIKRGGGNGFADIAGMDDLKELLRQRVIMILQDRELAEKYKLTPPNGMLLYGPPGCGKSFFAEKFAEETGFNFILVKASDLGSIYIHGSQGKIADLFKKAEENAPTVLCFDEFDAFVPSRSGDVGPNQAGEVNEFLSQLNNCSKRGIFVIATSNRPDKVDPAVLRTGRIDKQVYVPMPDKTARRLMFELYLKDRPCGELNSEELAEKSDGYVASDIAYVVNEAATIAAFNRSDITQDLLVRTIEGIKPSINSDLIKEYEQMRQQMEGIIRSNALPRVGFK
jgi:transitional endoplasmic reticulum ATPase